MAEETTDSIRDRLRAVPVFPETLLAFDPHAAPANPVDLLTEWLIAAIEGGVSQPHAMALATTDADGAPTLRTLILKDLTPEGLWFASLSSSPKGRDLAADPRAAVLLYWREQGRQVRVTGTVAAGGRELAERDFLARHPDARAGAIAGPQSAPLPNPAAVELALASAREFIAAHPDTVPPDWTAYLLRPERIEFWQARPDRGQVRLAYQRHETDNWTKGLLWP